MPRERPLATILGILRGSSATGGPALAGTASAAESGIAQAQSIIIVVPTGARVVPAPLRPPSAASLGPNETAAAGPGR